MPIIAIARAGVPCGLRPPLISTYGALAQLDPGDCNSILLSFPLAIYPLTTVSSLGSNWSDIRRPLTVIVGIVTYPLPWSIIFISVTLNPRRWAVYLSV